MAVGTRPINLPSSAATVSPPQEAELYRLSVDQYHHMLERGILTEGEPVELLEGLLVKQMTKKPPHVVATGLVQDALAGLVPEGWHVSVQDPVTTDESEPEPDLKVVRGYRRDYLDRHPGPGDIALVVEVADTSLATDLGIKKRIYARAGVPWYWVLNLPARRLEAYSEPTGPDPIPDFRQRREYAEGESVPLFLKGQEVGRIQVSDLLP